MAVKIKFLRNELIRRFGSTILEVQENVANKYIGLGMAVLVEETKKGIKEFKKDELKEMIDNNKVIYPGAEDTLFPQIKE